MRLFSSPVLDAAALLRTTEGAVLTRQVRRLEQNEGAGKVTQVRACSHGGTIERKETCTSFPAPKTPAVSAQCSTRKTEATARKS